MTEVEMQEFFDEFYEEVFTECEDKVIFVFFYFDKSIISEFSNVFNFQYGEIEEMNVCENLGDHLIGNVYVKV